ncbi:MAG TPA: hypothetical protein PLO19_06555 [Candidatus Cryosericum sp.]|nr:hypothetical protein [Candidatus Cryosericum sp.]
MRDQPLKESSELESLVLDQDQRNTIADAMLEIQDHPHDFELSAFWKLDDSVGGITGRESGKEMLNQQHLDVARSIFRPLQYAVTEFFHLYDRSAVYETAKFSVLSSGQHVEAAAKYFLRRRLSLFRQLETSRYTLGTSLNEIRKEKLLSDSVLKPSWILLDLYNSAKHEVNHDPDREWRFAPGDALICYAAARIIGNEMLRPYYADLLSSEWLAAHRIVVDLSQTLRPPK